MSIPKQTLTIQDPGLGLVEAATTIPLFMGPSEKGTVNAIATVSNKRQVVDTWGQGPLSEHMCRALDEAGGPILGMRITGDVAGAAGAVTKVAAGSSTGTVTVAQAPYDAYEVIATIVTTGGLGAATFTYSLDDGRTVSPVLTVPAGGVYSIPGTNLQITFVPGAGPTLFEAGDTHSFDCTAPYFSTTELGNAFDVVDVYTSQIDFFVLCGRPADSTAGATMLASLQTRLAGLESAQRYMGAIMDVGIDTTANVITNVVPTTGVRVCPTYGTADMASSKPITGWGTPKLPATVLIAARAHSELISTDLARTASGALDGVVEISHDEFLTEELDQHKISTLRTWPNVAGFYITNARMKSSLGSDFLYWQHRRVMDVACRRTVQSQFVFSSSGLRTNADGTIDTRDAVRIENTVKDGLRAELVDPQNAEGTQGHVSALNFTVTRTNNVQVTNEVLTAVAVRPLGYAKTLTTEIGFTTDVGG